MAVKIRLQRGGKTNYAQYRVVATDGRVKRDGKCIEILGWYNPHAEENKESVKLDRVDYWASVGAQLSPTVKQIVKRQRKAATAS